MPKSRVRKKSESSSAVRAASRAATQAAGRRPAPGPSSPLYVGIMLALMVLGLIWIVIYYLWGHAIPLMTQLGGWNLAVGFTLIVSGLLMTMRWR